MRRAWLAAGVLLLGACSTNTPATQPTPAPVSYEPVIGQTVVPGSRAPSGNVVPDVVGRNHQEAQDLLQASGFYNLDEEDATGRDRLLVADRNWVVVDQEPRGGTVLDPKQKITLRSKKYSD